MKSRSSEDRAPHLDLKGLPPEEIMPAWSLSNSINRLVEHTSDFQAALALFDFCLDTLKASDNDQREANLPLRQWQRMAGRDGAMSLYHFGETNREIKKAIGRYPVLFSRVDARTLDEAWILLEHRFPMRQSARHSIA